MIDSIYFGMFYKHEDSYHFVNTFSEEFPENLDVDKEQVGLNIQGIAEVCFCSVDHVSQFLAKMREQV